MNISFIFKTLYSSVIASKGMAISNVVTYAAGTDTSNSLTAIENGDFGMVTYDNKGMTVKTSFKLQILVTVSYPYGDVAKVITVTVLSANG